MVNALAHGQPFRATDPTNARTADWKPGRGAWLRWSDVDRAAGTVSIHGSVPTVAGGIVIKDTTTHAARRIAIESEKLAALAGNGLRRSVADGGIVDSEVALVSVVATELPRSSEAHATPADVVTSNPTATRWIRCAAALPRATPSNRSARHACR